MWLVLIWKWLSIIGIKWKSIVLCCMYDERERVFIVRGDVNKVVRGNFIKIIIERDFWWCRGNESGFVNCWRCYD